MARYFKTISIENLKKKIGSPKNLCEVTQDVKKDLSKVEFSFENIVTKSDDLYGKHNKQTALVGYHTLSNGITFLGVQAGSDFEHPIFFIIYWNGKRLRAYIPKRGNVWNTSEKSAYGNNKKYDAINAKKRGFIEQLREYNSDTFSVPYNWKKIEKEVIAYIQPM